MYLKLIRERPEGKAVRGALYEVHFVRIGAGGHREQLVKICDTLENRDYQVTPLIYKVEVTMSPKFKRLMPVLCGVAGRSGIRIHVGYRPEHSKGCILVESRATEEKVTKMLLDQKSETRIEISERPLPKPLSTKRGDVEWR